ncbi:MAG TPA: hypothetical protein VFG33_34250 [Kribbella sp.]|uniref:hypothetical protein n=1 Tax=Kribbella sp. TaxID=1871183 RepID=UPI002D79BCD4|nr:hypothetical protein [Kribbella sp.]HET6298486.1 hypothetical protein [Kribbella sp.]
MESQEDLRGRPIVLQSDGTAPDSARRSPARYLAWAGTAMLALAAAVGLVAGGTAVWSAFDPGTPGQAPAPLWPAPPATVKPQAVTATPSATHTSPDDHGDDHTSTPTSTDTTEPGDDKGGLRKSGSDDNSGSGKSDDRSGHR